MLYLILPRTKPRVVPTSSRSECVDEPVTHMSDPVDREAWVAAAKAEHAAKQRNFKEAYALADMEAKTTILAKPIDLPKRDDMVVPIKREKPRASKDGKLKAIDVSEIEVAKPESAVPSKGTIDAHHLRKL